MLHALLGLAVFGLITSTVFAGMALAAVPAYLRQRRPALARLAERPGYTPPLTLLKPLHGDEPGLAAHLASFFEQDYPEYEILFCARSDDDAGLRVARQVAARYPRIPARFFSTGEPDYINAKVASLEKMEAAAAHEILVISDSDVRVTPVYLRAVALPFADAQVGAMCCPYRGVAAEGGLWARLEAVGMSVEMTAGVLVARAVEGMQFVLGPTMAFRRETIRRMGGFRIAADYCADDFVLGHEIQQAGPGSRAEPSSYRPHGAELQLHGLAQAPGAVDEVDALLAAQGAPGHGAYLQLAVRPAGLAGGVAARPSVLGPGALWLEPGHALGAGCRGRANGGRRSELVRPAGPLSAARPDGLRLLGGQLPEPARTVARAGVRAAAGGQDAGGEVAKMSSLGHNVAQRRGGSCPRMLLFGLALTRE